MILNSWILKFDEDDTHDTVFAIAILRKYYSYYHIDK